ncbi:GGDEF domain-containing protein [Temperatibacter marinus]|uniref:GGDEF domain-containing protein n=1 Tax=Temperatibacter marinus TaxID=1456591 RepID=A0AA52EK51_9PROT|nr:GGDEF domain-containing protein [Temperatibacter marinus]WND04002.1 GGDEF domain-containing protein [Temperatibacter marinus]
MIEQNANYVSMAIILLILAGCTYISEREKAKFGTLRLLRITYVLMAIGWLISLRLSSDGIFIASTVLGALFVPYFAAYPFLRSGKPVPLIFVLLIFTLSTVSYSLIILNSLPMNYFYWTSAFYVTVGLGFGLYYTLQSSMGELKAHAALITMLLLTILIVDARAIIHYIAERGFTEYKPAYDYIWGPVYVGLALSVLGGFLEESIKTNRRLMTVDKVTGLLNREGFAAKIQKDIQGIQVNGMSVIRLQIGNYHRLADKVGYFPINKELRLFKNNLKVSMPHNAIMARLGGGDFIVLLPNIDLYFSKPATDEFLRLMKRAQKDTGGALQSDDDIAFAENNTIEPPYVIGGITLCNNAEEIDAAVVRAEGYLEEAKLTGSNLILTDKMI